MDRKENDGSYTSTRWRSGQGEREWEGVGGKEEEWGEKVRKGGREGGGAKRNSTPPGQFQSRLNPQPPTCERHQKTKEHKEFNMKRR